MEEQMKRAFMNEDGQILVTKETADMVEGKEDRDNTSDDISSNPQQ
jgi:hypothetical protein